MKKAKLFTILLLVLGLFCSIFTLASCTKKTHTHSYANDWSQDELFHWQKCLGCETIRNKAEHDWNLGIVTLEPTEISEGIKTYTCNTCGQTQIESIPKIGAHEHTFSESWSSDDTYHWHASTCEHTNEISSKETHHWDAGVVTKQPTETTEGEKTYTCDVCLKTKVASIGTLGHVHTFDTEYSFDDNYHWYATTCGHSGEVREKSLTNGMLVSFYLKQLFMTKV